MFIPKIITPTRKSGKKVSDLRVKKAANKTNRFPIKSFLEDK
jgi:hypothetical protein